MKRNLFILFFVLCISGYLHGQAKYVFLFIGDGMGLNQVNAAEIYLADLEGHVGVTPLDFTQMV
jgi:alkaline phosphatase